MNATAARIAGAPGPGPGQTVKVDARFVAFALISSVLTGRVASGQMTWGLMPDAPLSWLARKKGDGRDA